MMWSASIGYVLQGSKQEWDLSSIEVGLIGCFFPAGLMLGAFVWSVIGDRYGRMYSFKNSVILAGVASICLLFSMDFIMVCASILVLGIGIGIGGELALAGTVFCEFCPPSKMYYLTIMAVFWGVGGTYTALAAFIISLTNNTSINNWRFIVGACSLVEIMCILFRIFMKETPEYCLQKGQIEKAEKILNIISRENTGEDYKPDTLLQTTQIQSNTTRDEARPEVSSFRLISKIFKGKVLKPTILLGLVKHI